MELALHMGMTSEALSLAMTERELQRWRKYASTRMLPFKRLELLLAQVSFLLVKVMGTNTSHLRMEDFMLFRQKDDEVLPENVSRIDAARSAFGFRPRVRKKG